jgi:hypothetical protein
MKTGLAILLPALIFCWSCHKSNSAVSGGTGSWNIFNHEHIVNYSTRKDTAGMVLLTVQDTLPTAQNPFVNTLSVLFGSLPTDSANFDVVSSDEPFYPGSLSIFVVMIPPFFMGGFRKNKRGAARGGRTYRRRRGRDH